MHGGAKEPKRLAFQGAAACRTRPPEAIADASKFDVAQRGHCELLYHIRPIQVVTPLKENYHKTMTVPNA
jgi:hypothetical protein